MICQQAVSGWCNASKGMDAWGCQNASFGNLWKATAEINESIFPTRHEWLDYETDTGGPGRWRGLPGSRYVKRLTAPRASRVCIVDMTRWPVSAAVSAICAVS